MSRHQFIPSGGNSRHPGTACRKLTCAFGALTILAPSLTHRRFFMSTSTFRESILDQVAITAVLIITALMTLNQFVLLM